MTSWGGGYANEQKHRENEDKGAISYGDYHHLDRRLAMTAVPIREALRTTWRDASVRAYVQTVLVDLRRTMTSA